MKFPRTPCGSPSVLSRRRAAFAVLAVALLGGRARADEPNNSQLVCRPDLPEMDKYAWLRALSLDLRGNLPTAGELAALDGQPDVPDALIDQWLANEDFVTQAVRRHRDLLWTNIKNIALVNYQAFFDVEPKGSLYYRSQPARLYRGGPVPCDDTPAQLVSGVIQTRTDKDGYLREGWVMVSP